MIKVGSLLTGSARYTEAPESGSMSDSVESGVRTRVVSNVYQCYKDETRTIMDAMEAAPALLLSAGGRNPNGTPANYINWGAGFELTGLDSSEMSPSFSRITARYTATDPVSGAGIPQTGTPHAGCIVGRPWEGGQRYVETPASGKAVDTRTFISDSFGWNRSRQVDVALICEKPDVATIAEGLAVSPAALTTNPYSGSKVEWGGGFSLVSIYGTPMSPTLYAITAKYRKNKAWAIAYPPAGLSLTCVAGVCSLIWNGVTFEQLDSGDPTNTKGIDVQIINGWTALMTCNGVPFSDFTPGNKVGTGRVLEWTTSGTAARLCFCGEVWKEFVT